MSGNRRKLKGRLPFKRIYLDCASTWIGNFGVVPLLRFVAFLSLPIFFFLFALLVFVTRVLETITILPEVLFSLFKAIFLPRAAFYVKALFILSIPLAHGAQTVLLSQGEHYGINIDASSNFFITNKQIITHKYLKEQGKLYIKGAALGMSEVVILKAKGKKRTYKIYVLNKGHFGEALLAARALQGLGASIEHLGETLIVKGDIHDLSTYSLAHSYAKKFPNRLQLQIHLAKKLKEKIITEVYQHLFEEGITSPSCQEYQGHLTCFYSELTPLSEKLQKFLVERYAVEFIAHKTQEQRANYLLKIKFIQIEHTAGEHFRLGLDQLTGDLGALMRNDLKSFVTKNQILLNDQNLELSTLATQEIILRQGQPAEFKMGSEVPYFPPGKRKNIVVWKFVGLKLHFLVTRRGAGLDLSFETQLSHPPKEQTVGGSSQKSVATLTPGDPLKLFELDMTVQGTELSSFPFLSKIPLLGKLFTSQHKKTTFKKISAVAVLEKQTKGLL